MANARKPSAERWSAQDGRITFAFHEDGTASLRKAGKNEDAASSFDPSQPSEMADLWAELVNLNRAFRTSTLWLRSAEKAENGFFVGIDGDLVSTYKKGDEEVEFPFAYAPDQLVAFKPVAFNLKRKWNGYAVSPGLQAYAATNGVTGRSSSFTRTVNTAEKATLQAAPAAPAVTYRRTQR